MMNLLGFIMSLVYMQAVHGRLSTYERLVNSQKFFSPYLTQEDTEWFGRIDASGGAVFFAAGVFYYFLSGQVRTLVQAMEKAFPGGRLVFGAANRTAVKMMLKTWIKDAQIKDVGAYFAVSDAVKELGAWSPDMRVSSRGYMLGYQSLDCVSVKGAYRFLAKVGDGLMKMQIVRLDFGGGCTGGV